MTDEQLDKIIDGARADLRKSIRSVLEGAGSHLFTIGRMPLPSGQNWDVSVLVLNEPTSMLIEKIIGEAIPAMTRSYLKLGPATPAAATAAAAAIKKPA